MEMDMQEPGEMCCCCEEEHGLAKAEKTLQKKAVLHTAVCPIINSFRGIN